MSENLYNDYLAKSIYDYLCKSIKPGQIYSYKDADIDTCFKIVESILKQGASINDSDRNEFSIIVKGVTLFVVCATNSLELKYPFQITLAYATRLRNEIADFQSIDIENNKRSLLIFTDRDLDTLDASIDLVKSGLDSDRIGKNILELLNTENKLSQALYIYINKYIKYFSSNDYNILLDINKSIISGDYTKVGKDISKISHGFFNDSNYLPHGINKDIDLTLKRLEKNHNDFVDLQECFPFGTASREKLMKIYKEEFVNKILQTQLENISGIEYSVVELNKRKEMPKPQTIRPQKFLNSIRNKHDFWIIDANKDHAIIEFNKEIDNYRLSFEVDSLNIEALASGKNLILNTKKRGFSHNILKIIRENKTIFSIPIITSNTWLYDISDKITYTKGTNNPIEINGDFEYLLDENPGIIKFFDGEEINPQKNTRYVPEFDNDKNSILLTVNDYAFSEKVSLYVNRISETKKLLIGDIPILIESLKKENIYFDSSGEKIYELIDNKTKVKNIDSQEYSFSSQNIKLIEMEIKMIKNHNPFLYQETLEDYDDIINCYNTERVLEPLRLAYDKLFDLFRDSNETPSLSPWDHNIIRVAKKVEREYINVIKNVKKDKDFGIVHKTLTRIGLVSNRQESSSETNLKLSPFTPIVISYITKLKESIDSFPSLGSKYYKARNSKIFLNPSGLIPHCCLFIEDDIHYLESRRNKNNNFWLDLYSIDRESKETIPFFEQIFKDTLIDFFKLNKILFEIDTQKSMIVSLVNIGDYTPLINALHRIFEQYENFPNIKLVIYGGPGEGKELDEAFVSDSYNNKTFNKKSLEAYEMMKEKVLYVKKGQFSDDGGFEFSHISFIKDVTNSMFTTCKSDTFENFIFLDGILPLKAFRLSKDHHSNNSYEIGIGLPKDQSDAFFDSVKYSNELSAMVHAKDVIDGYFIRNVNTFSVKTKIFEKSIWVTHLLPKTNLEFYLKNDSNTIVNYSNHHDVSTPYYDVITFTQFSALFISALSKIILDEPRFSGLIEPNEVFKNLVAIDGGIPGKLKSHHSEIMETIGMACTLAFSTALLNEQYAEKLWIPVNLSEIVRQSKSVTGDPSGLMSLNVDGHACDDFCFVGLSNNIPTIDIWIVESKYGSSDITRGIEQVKKTVDEFKEKLSPKHYYIDTNIIKSFFGRIVYDVATRLDSYGLINEEKRGFINDENRFLLLNGSYGVNFVKTIDNKIGDVINTTEDYHISAKEYDQNVRVIVVPIEAIKLLKGEKNISEIFPGFTLSNLLT